MKENFDDIIRRRWEAQQFPVDDVHRQEMARLLEGEKKRRGFIFWWIGGLAVTLLIGFALWIFSAPRVKDQPRTEYTENTEKEAKAKTEENAEIVVRPAETHPDATAQQPAEENETTKYTHDKTTIGKISKSSEASKANHLSKTKNKIDQNKVDVKSRTKNTESTESVNTNNEKAINSGTSAEAAQRTGGKPAASEIPEGGYKVELENPNQASILSNEASIKVFPDSIEYDPWTNAIYRDGTVRSLNITKPVDALSIQEVENLTPNAPGNITPHTKMTHPVYFIAETGLGMVLASKPYYDGGIKFNVGGGLGMKLIPRVHLQLTGGYLMQDGGFHFERTSTVNTLSFGVRSQFNSLQPDRLHFIYTKLGAAYRFQRSTLDVHMGVQWLYGAQGNIIIQQQSQVPPGNNEETHYAWLNTEGLRTTQWWSDVSYGYMLLPKFYLHGGVTFFYSSLMEANVPSDGYDWNGKTATVQPFITLNYLLHANF